MALRHSPRESQCASIGIAALADGFLNRNTAGITARKQIRINIHESLYASIAACRITPTCTRAIAPCGADTAGVPCAISAWIAP